MVLLATAAGEQHGLINTLTNSVSFDDFKNMTPPHKAHCEKEKKDDSRIVKARYINHQGRHERLTKPYCRWAGQSIQIWHLIPGYEYDLPYGFIKEVNGVKPPPVRSGLQEIDGKAVTESGAPTEKDMPGYRVHELVPVAF